MIITLNDLRNDISTYNVTVDMLNHIVTVWLPDNVLEEIDRNHRRIEFIIERQHNPKYKSINFHYVIKDTPRFLDDLNELMKEHEGDLISMENIYLVDTELHMLCDQFMYSEKYNIHVA